jgi:putative transposase
MRNDAHANGFPFVSDAELSRQVITEAKKRPDRAWLGQVSAVVLQQALADCTAAFRNFFTVSQKGKLVLPKIGEVAVRWSRGLPTTWAPISTPPASTPTARPATTSASSRPSTSPSP